ncbi:hypothetical protein CAEBREN_13007 [Caenorhabditis brenneri]|uniref:Uncharacterized protein n=1 Tax=Caenorhabditis brenneri TaxID=135651 RepID=G0PGS0_CAEBE|nr:hypothetical protein CAEBREN_13007 [Caenorhabditis brenneri]
MAYTTIGNPKPAAPSCSTDKERIRMLENENRRLGQELAKYQLNPENLDLTPFLHNQDRGLAGHPQVVQLTTRTNQFYNFYKNSAIPPFQELDEEEKKKWSKVFGKMRRDQKDQVARNLIQYVKKEVVELD